MKIVKVKNVKTPKRATDGSAGIDFYLPEGKEVYIHPGDSRKIESGIHVKIPAGYALVFMNRSSMAANKKVIIGACLIDEDYQGEIVINLINLDRDWVQVLKPGDCIAQAVLIPINYENVEEVNNLKELYPRKTKRGSGGFGSTNEK